MRKVFENVLFCGMRIEIPKRKVRKTKKKRKREKDQIDRYNEGRNQRNPHRWIALTVGNRLIEILWGLVQVWVIS